MKMDDTRLAGAAGMLSTAVMVPAFMLLVTLRPGGGAERTMGNFEAQPATMAATFGLFLVTQVLYIVFLAGLDRHLRNRAPIVSRTSLGIGVVGLILGMLSIHVIARVGQLLAPSEATGNLAGTDLLEALHLGLSTVAMLGGTASILLVGFGIFGFGVAMLWDAPFGAPFAYATVGTGLFIAASVLLDLFPLPVLAMYGYGALGGAVLWGHAANPTAAEDVAEPAS